MANENHVVTGRARLSYVHLLQPYASKNNPEEKYSTTVLVPKGDIATKQRIDAAIEAAIQVGVKDKWGGRPAKIAVPVYDGDQLNPNSNEPFGAECRGHWVFTASCKKDRPPRVVDAQVQDIIDARKVYSGIYGRVGVDFFPYNQAGKKGIGCGLSNVQVLEDGEPLGNHVAAEEDFGAPQMPAYQAPVQQPYAVPAYQPPMQQPQYQQPPVQGYGYPPTVYGQPQQPQQAAQPPWVDPLTGMPL